MIHTEMTRRSMLRNAACGFGSLAFAGMQDSFGLSANPLAAKTSRFPQRAKRVIFIFMAGGPSHLDTFDYKPELYAKDGKEIDFVGVRTGTFGKKDKRKLMKPLWDFKRYGQSGRYVSSLFPHIAEQVDDLAFIHSMHTEGVAHGPSTLFMHTGATNLVRPSMGSWISYGLGTENENLPAFVTIAPSASKEAREIMETRSCLPFIRVRHSEEPEAFAEAKIRNIENAMLSDSQRRQRFEFLQSMNSEQAKGVANDDRMEATIKSYELAWRMQMEVPELTDLNGETKAIQKLYGIDEKETSYFGKQCLLARRMVERGVRFVSVNYSDESNNPRWDQHSNLHKHAIHAKATDKPVAGLLKDLKARGLLEDTLVWWGESSEGLLSLKTKTVEITTQEVLRFFLQEVAFGPESPMGLRMKSEVWRWMNACTCMICMQRSCTFWELIMRNSPIDIPEGISG